MPDAPKRVNSTEVPISYGNSLSNSLNQLYFNRYFHSYFMFYPGRFPTEVRPESLFRFPRLN
jgi:hypothetical protein